MILHAPLISPSCGSHMAPSLCSLGTAQEKLRATATALAKKFLQGGRKAERSQAVKFHPPPCEVTSAPAAALRLLENPLPGRVRMIQDGSGRKEELTLTTSGL